MKQEISLGGQAVVEGVLMRTKIHYSVAVRNPKGKIIIRKEKITTSNIKLLQLPLIRGVLALYETMAIGFRAILWSSNIASDEDEQLSSRDTFFAVATAVIFALGIFVAVPFFLASLVTSDNLIFNVVDGILRLAALFGYLVLISFFKDVQRLFQYHGAEHMTIHAYEHNEMLTPQNIRKYRTMHPRCGTSFLLIVVVLSIFVFSVITSDHFLVKFLSRIILIPVIAGISYEVLKFSARHQENVIVKPLTFPGIWMQYITTKRPDDRQIEVAVASLKSLVKN